MMVVVAVIGGLAALAAPAIGAARTSRLTNQAAHDVARLGRRARSEAMAYGRAHIIRYSLISADGRSSGSVQLWRGRVNRCASNPWSTIVTGSCAGSLDCVEEVDMTSYSTSSRRIRFVMAGASSAAICFEPDGDTFVATPSDSSLFSTAVPGGREAPWFAVAAYTSAGRSVVRNVVFPMGGIPRVR
jgi:Tfp pilus assembly protein FimT